MHAGASVKSVALSVFTKCSPSQQNEGQNHNTRTSNESCKSMSKFKCMLNTVVLSRYLSIRHSELEHYT